MTAQEKILHLFTQVKELSVKEIVEKLNVSKQTVHIVLNRLLAESKVKRLGRPPKTVYRLADERSSINPPDTITIDDTTRAILNENFLVVTETGNLLEGIDAFTYWCKQRKQPVEKTLREFLTTREKYTRYYSPDGVINGMEKLRNTKGYNKIWLDDIYYLDFYAIERFGKTKLGTLLHYAKQGQNKFLMTKMMKEAKPKIIALVNSLKADAVGFVPPTIRRELQIMKFIQSDLKLSLPVMDIKKLSGIIPIPQKSLNNLDERVRNAEATFAVTEQRKFEHVVLIDDAVGSGATLNEIAEKIKDKGVAQKVTGLAIIGSFKGFDVITDV
ncbi:MAG: DeoR family transcriptional regulator [Bacteroidota bacterium]